MLSTPFDNCSLGRIKHIRKGAAKRPYSSEMRRIAALCATHRASEEARAVHLTAGVPRCATKREASIGAHQHLESLFRKNYFKPEL